MTDQRQQIEKAARIMESKMPRRAHPECALEAAQALVDAGMLTDPQVLADLSAAYRDARTALKDRAEKAEAEAVYLEADYDERGYKLWRLAAKAGHEPSEADNDADAEHSIATALAERDRALAALQRVRDLADEWTARGTDGVPIRPHRAAERIRAILDDKGDPQ